MRVSLWLLPLLYLSLLHLPLACARAEPKVSDEITGSFEMKTAPVSKVSLTPQVVKEIKMLAEITRKLSTPAWPAPQRTLIYGSTFPIEKAAPEYSAAVQKFIAATGATALAAGESRRGWIKVDGQNLTQIANFSVAPPDEKIEIVDLGENLKWPQPDNSDAFRLWLKLHYFPFDFVDGNARSWADVKFSLAPETANSQPALYYYSHLFARELTLSYWAEKSAALQRAFPNAGVLGRFESTPFGEVTSHIAAFQKRAFTAPRVDLQDADSLFDFYEIDLLRAGIRGRETDLDSKIYADISSPTKDKPEAWRQRFYGALAHGAKTFDIGKFAPTEIRAPRELKRALSELSTFENIVQDGKLKPAQTALLVGETGDIWHNATSARRALYGAARENQIPLDFLTESEVQNGDLKNYKVLLLADRNLSRKAAKAVFDWVQNGGTLVATAGAGMRDELDQKNILLFEQWNIRELEYSENSSSQLQTSTRAAVGSVKWNEIETPVFDARSRFDIGANLDEATRVLASFEGGAPAVVSHRAGEGVVIYAGFRPYSQNTKPDSNAAAHSLSWQLMQFVLMRVYRPVVCFVGLDEISAVETNVIESAGGIAIPFINRSGKPIKKLAVRLPFIAAYGSCALASGGRVLLNRDELGLFAIFDLDVADALVFK